MYFHPAVKFRDKVWVSNCHANAMSNLLTELSDGDENKRYDLMNIIDTDKEPILFGYTHRGEFHTDDEDIPHHFRKEWYVTNPLMEQHNAMFAEVYGEAA